MPSELILASASTRRAGLLDALGVRYRQIESAVDERSDTDDPAASAVAVALAKARSVQRSHPTCFVLGADTIVISPVGETLGKPVDDADALRMLLSLSGGEHEVITGLALVGPGVELSDSESTRVQMCDFDEEEARRYVRSGEPEDKAGAYGIQGKGGLLVESVTGCYFNVVGLPIRLLYEMVKDRGVAERWLGPDSE